jgi:hypothetical protein
MVVVVALSFWSLEVDKMILIDAVDQTNDGGPDQ